VAGRERWAVDTTVVISFLKGNEVIRDKPASDYSRALFRRAENGEAVLLVSALSIVEVCKPHRKCVFQEGVGNIDAVTDFFEHSYVEIFELERQVARRAQKLTRDLGVPSWDAVHLATALLGRADYLFTWDDDDLIKHSPVEGLQIREPFADIIPSPAPPDHEQTTLPGTE
jgi:predicted nucleic acid-binding protein